MKRTKVTSSHIDEIGYDAESKTLEVLFIGGGLYRYLEVPVEEHEALMAAESHGRYLNKIKGKYQYESVSDES